MGIGHQGGEDIDHCVDDATVTGMLDLLDVFDLVVDRLNKRAFAQ
jgi:hypothetical protein